MAQSAIVNSFQLETGLILVPERYDPRRYPPTHTGIKIADIARIVSEQVTSNKGSQNYRYLVLDTSDAKAGIIQSNKEPISLEEIGSAKKVIKPGDVIISRLRPYLRQVAYVDTGLFTSMGESIVVVCSTEFFVLRSYNNQSIAFLVPYLLSDTMQKILSASQEGGHHPRFNRMALQKIPIPESLIRNRDEISTAVELAVNQARLSQLSLQSLVSKCSSY
jgi:hypothetical protein